MGCPLPVPSQKNSKSKIDEYSRSSKKSSFSDIYRSSVIEQDASQHQRICRQLDDTIEFDQKDEKKIDLEMELDSTVRNCYGGVVGSNVNQIIEIKK